jgi:hypothetical protein
MPTTISLGFETPDYSKLHATSAPEPVSESKIPTKTAYPSITIPGNKQLAQALKVGDKITATVTFSVCEVCLRDRKGDENRPVDEYSGTRVELEAESMTFDNLKVDADEGEDATSAFKKYLAKKGKTANSDEGDED